MKERHDPLIDACVSCAQFYISAVQKQLDPTKKCSLVRQRFLLQQLFCLRDNTNEVKQRLRSTSWNAHLLFYRNLATNDKLCTGPEAIWPEAT